MLKDRGYKVRPVPSGKLALLAARRDPPDLILLDINMPDMNGYEVCEHLKADETLKGVPIIFISALTEPLDKVKAFAIGGVDYLTKPFHMEELHARVETHLKLRQLRAPVGADQPAARAGQHAGCPATWRRPPRSRRRSSPGIAPDIPGTEFAWSYRPVRRAGRRRAEHHPARRRAGRRYTSWTSAGTASRRPCCRCRSAACSRRRRTRRRS